MKVRINRKKWLRGYDPDTASCLWNEKVERGCCLGHVTRQYKHCSWNQLEGIGFPSDLNIAIPGIDDEVEIGSINDDDSISDTERERQLIVAFKACGIEIEFYG